MDEGGGESKKGPLALTHVVYTYVLLYVDKRAFDSGGSVERREEGKERLHAQLIIRTMVQFILQYCMLFQKYKRSSFELNLKWIRTAQNLKEGLFYNDLLTYLLFFSFKKPVINVRSPLIQRFTSGT